MLTYAQIDAAERMLQSQADILAPLLSRSVRHLRLVEWDTDGGLWRTYRISRPDRGDADNVARALYDDTCSTKVRLRIVCFVNATCSADAVPSISVLTSSWTY